MTDLRAAGFADAGFADARFADTGFADKGFADAGFAVTEPGDVDSRHQSQGS